jgi:hypothetical protein
MSARVDSTPDSTVVWCTLCPAWSELAADKESGHDAAALHDLDVHPGEKGGGSALQNRAAFRQYNGLPKRDAKALQIL